MPVFHYFSFSLVSVFLSHLKVVYHSDIKDEGAPRFIFPSSLQDSCSLCAYELHYLRRKTVYNKTSQEFRKAGRWWLTSPL